MKVTVLALTFLTAGSLIAQQAPPGYHWDSHGGPTKARLVPNSKPQAQSPTSSPSSVKADEAKALDSMAKVFLEAQKNAKQEADARNAALLRQEVIDSETRRIQNIEAEDALTRELDREARRIEAVERKAASERAIARSNFETVATLGENGKIIKKKVFSAVQNTTVETIPNKAKGGVDKVYVENPKSNFTQKKTEKVFNKDTGKYEIVYIEK